MASDQHTQRGKEVFLQFTFFVSIQVFFGLQNFIRFGSSFGCGIFSLKTQPWLHRPSTIFPRDLGFSSAEDCPVEHFLVPFAERVCTSAS